MVDVPAWRIVQDRIKARLETIGGYTVTIDRREGEPFAESELPAINIRLVAVQLSRAPDSFDTQLHAATFNFDLLAANGAAETIDAANQIAAARVLAAMMEDWTLGGRLFDWIETAVSGSEMDGADVGQAILECEAHFATARANPFAIVGAANAIFTD